MSKKVKFIISDEMPKDPQMQILQKSNTARESYLVNLW